MPTYEYECLECKHRFEVFQSMTDNPVSRCSKCNGKVKRLIGAGGGIIFKGSGFYVTDYKNTHSVKGGETRKSENSGGNPGKEKKSKEGEADA